MIELRTPRLLLRPLSSRDANAVAAIAGDWRVARMVVDMPYPMDRAGARAWLRRRSGERRLAIVHAGRMIGGVMYYRHPGGSAQLGYWLGPSWWGNGFAAEAASHLVAYGFERDRLARFWSGHFLDNPASAKVLLSLGFKRQGRCLCWCPARGREVEAVTYELDRAAAGYPAHPPGFLAWSALRLWPVTAQRPA